MTILLREAIGDRLRHARTSRSRTLRDVSRAARVSLGYLSEVERGRKEASSELLASICEALDLPLSELLHNVASDIGAVAGVERVERVDMTATPPREQVPGRGPVVERGSGIEGGTLAPTMSASGIATTDLAELHLAAPLSQRLGTTHLGTALAAAGGVTVAA